jgi:hypothetical protein
MNRLSALYGLFVITYICLCITNYYDYDFKGVQTETGRDPHRRAGAYCKATRSKDPRPRPEQELRAFRPVAIIQKDGTKVKLPKVASFK